MYGYLTQYSCRIPKEKLTVHITDLQSYDALSHAGNSVLQTPNIDSIVDQNAYFKTAYTLMAANCSDRMSSMTGHTAKNTGITNSDAYFYTDPGLMSDLTFDDFAGCKYKYMYRNPYEMCYQRRQK